ncbi:MAG: M28 family metallopeptidase [Acidobacteriota bacterium]
MKLALALCVAACGPSATSNTDPGSLPTGDPQSSSIWDRVDARELGARLAELTGEAQVSVDGATYSITNRWSPLAKQRFRAYWTAYMTSLGADVSEVTFPVSSALAGETTGHDLEAVLPGRSPDSVVIVVHYDTVGVAGSERANPGADDDGSGLAMQLEAARIFAQITDRANTVRFVAADYEEISDDLAGDQAYVAYLQKQAALQRFQILVASDNDQTGWSCWSDGLCTDDTPDPDTTFELISCSGDSNHWDFPSLADGLAAVADRHGSALQPTPLCDGSGDTDHYAFWQAGIPAYVIEEWSADQNPHFDNLGDDTMAHIDFGLLAETARIQITFQAQLAGITP